MLTDFSIILDLFIGAMHFNFGLCRGLEEGQSKPKIEIKIRKYSNFLINRDKAKLIQGNTHTSSTLVIVKSV